MRLITLDDNNKVVSVRFGNKIVGGEIHSEVGEVGQIMLEDGTFITPEPENIGSLPTIEEEILYENKYQTLLLEMGML